MFYYLLIVKYFNKAGLFLLLYMGFSISICSQDKILKFSHITVDDGLSQNTIRGIVKDKYGFMWFGTWNGLCKYDGYKFTIYRSEIDNPKTISNNRIHYVYKDSNGNIWVSSHDKTIICRYNYETDDFIRIPWKDLNPSLKDSIIRTKIKAGNIINYEQYLWKINPNNNLLCQTNKITKDEYCYKSDIFNKWALNDETVSDIYLDDNDILWVGTLNGGVNRADLKAKPFVHYYHSPDNPNSLIDNNIRAITEDKNGFLWIGTRNNGITRIDRKNNKYYHLKKNNSPFGLLSNEIRKLYCDRAGFVWIGSKHGLDKYDPKTGIIDHFSEKITSDFPHKSVYCIMEDHENNLWIGTSQGFARYNREKNNFFNYNSEKYLKNKFVRAIIEDRNNNFWLAVEGGGVTLLKKKLKPDNQLDFIPVQYLYTPENRNSNRVYSLIEDENGIIWAGTAGGLSRLDPFNNKTIHFTTENGLTDELILGILNDGTGHLWISHKKGLTRLNIHTNKMRHYSQKDGLQGDEFSEDAYYRNSKTGEMFFGGIYGINSYFPEKIKNNEFFPQIAFTEFQVLNNPVRINQKINGRVILKQSLLFTKEIVLHDADKSFAIEFTALHYSNPSGNKYAYMLEGFDKNWIYTNSSKRVAAYSNLPAKTYLFKVKASNCDGLWNPIAAEIKIIVLPPWWKTYWAIILYIVITGLVILFVIKSVLSRQKLKNQLVLERLETEKVKDLEKMKIQFFTGVSHELRTPLSLIIDPLDKLINNRIPPEKAHNYYELMKNNAGRLIQMINQLLDFRKMEEGKLKINLTKNDLVLFIKSIAGSFQYMAENRNINFTVISDVPVLFMYFDSDKMEKVFYNLLTNAFKFTPDGGYVKVLIKLNKSNNNENIDLVEIYVEDSGIGIPKEFHDKIFELFYQVKDSQITTDNGTGIGLAFSKQLVELHNGKIAVKSEINKGTCFKVTLFLHESLSAEYSAYSNKEENNVNKQVSIIDTLHSNNSEKYNSNENGYTISDKPLILAVEDYVDVLHYIKEELSDEFNIVCTINGNEASAKAFEIIPDLVVSDIMIPGINGIELCKLLKTDERTSHIPIILLTANDSDEFRFAGYEFGADAYITKPFNIDLLRVRIHNLLEMRNKLKELFSKSTSNDLKVFPIENEFLNKVINLIEENISNPELDVETLAEKLNLSRTQLYRKIKSISNQSVYDFIKTIRLNKAAELMKTTDKTIAEISYIVGYSEPGNFARSFTKQFGQTPKSYINSIKENNKP